MCHCAHVKFATNHISKLKRTYVNVLRYKDTRQRAINYACGKPLCNNQTVQISIIFTKYNCFMHNIVAAMKERVYLFLYLIHKMFSDISIFNIRYTYRFLEKLE